MIIECHEEPAPELAEALAQFEREFSYPLRATQRFRISHGRDYARFFRAIDPETGTSFIALAPDGTVLGTLGIALRRLQMPAGEIVRTAYLADLKVRPQAARGRTLWRLARAATEWGRARGVQSGYGVVMDGTAQVPSAYTGKLEIPGFRPLGKLTLLRLSVAPETGSDARFDATAPEVEKLWRKLRRGTCLPLGGAAGVRSLVPPVALITPDNSACGLLEDTRRAKCLWLEEGTEMLSAHLSHFAFRDLTAAQTLLTEVSRRAAAHVSAVFVAIPADSAELLRSFLSPYANASPATATVYGSGLEVGDAEWSIATSEI